MTLSIGLIDYGMGNLHSVQQSFKRLGQPVTLVTKPEDSDCCDALILPGVGSFDPAITNLKEKNLIPTIKDWAKANKPLLGICLGLQLMFESSEEGSLSGLGIFKGQVNALPKDLRERVPHMGWALLNHQNKSPLLNITETSSWTYFVHSFAAQPLKQDIAATVNFGGQQITAMVWKGRIGACQFHPEKSGKAGHKLLSNWVNWLNLDAKKIS